MPLHRLLAVALVALSLIATVVGTLRPLPSLMAADNTSDTGIPAFTAPRSARLAVLALEGPIQGGDNGNFNGASILRKRLVAAAKEEAIKGVLLTINSPGGTIPASQELYRAIQSVQKAGKPVVVSMGDVAASGGYYAASAADVIYANPGTLTGSIGVILSGYNAEELLKKVGVQPQTIKTGAFKDIFAFSRPLTTPERELLQDIVDDSLDQFTQDILAGRQRLPNLPSNVETPVIPNTSRDLRQKLTLSKIKELADGRIFTGRQAIKIGLIDVLGGYEEALKTLRVMVGDEEEKLPLGGIGSNLGWIFDLLQQSSGVNPLSMLQPSLPTQGGTPVIKGLSMISQWDLPLAH